MRILHVLPSLSPGGMERLVIQLAADATARGDNVTVAAGAGTWMTRVEQAGARYVKLPATSRNASFAMVAAAARLARCVRQVNPDVVHAHNVRATALARLALAGTASPGVLMPTLHGVAPGDYSAASRILRRTARRVIACSPSVARSLGAAGFPADRIDVITNGAALQPARPARRAALRASLALGEEPLVIGIGRLVKQKDWPVFIAAASRIDGACFAIAGDGPLREELTMLARGSGNRVRFLGLVDDIAALIGLAACVVTTSSWEGLPLTLLEALSLGVPVVATAVDGVADVVPPAAALLVPAGDPGAVSHAVSRVLTESDLAANLRREALAAAPGWGPERMLRMYQKAYQAARTGEPRWA
jgi:glycosyltransferase involved in cell wall biosynthesis